MQFREPLRCSKRPLFHGSKKVGSISIRLDAELKAVLEELAGGDDRSLSSYINRALRHHVEALGRKLPIDGENAKKPSGRRSR
jgi:predicted HicB family RNase H-like nuclease